MELKHVKELMAAMGRTGTKKLLLKKDGFELQLEREENGSFKGSDVALELGEEFLSKSEHLNKANIALSKGKELSSSLAQGETTKEQEVQEGTYVTSPMVGTFYSAPSPEDATFVKVGDKIEKNTVVCIVEAMKVMNEVKAGVSGTVAELLLESGHPVEFGTKLFRIIQ